MIKKYKNLLSQANLNIKSETALILLINLILLVVGIISFILFNSIVVLFISFMAMFAFDIGLFYRYRNLALKNKINRLKSLSNCLSSFYLNLSHGVSFDDAIQQLKESDDLDLNKKAMSFLETIKIDCSITPFLNFAFYFDDEDVELIFISLFNYKNNKQKEDLYRFSRQYQKLVQKINGVLIRRNKRQFDFIKFSAVIGSSLILLTIVIAIILEVNKNINV